jgi:signal peptidase II
LKKALFTILSVLFLDQWIKIWIKTTFYYGQPKTIIPGWLDLQFVENPGMAFGWMLPGEGGKLALSIFRIIVVAGIAFYLWKLIRQKVHTGYILCVSLIIAGALGNIIDSAAYGLMFDKGSLFDPDIQDYGMYHGLATMGKEGYAPFLMGNVVDMFHITKQVSFPEWFPIWGGQTREIFPPVFNVADSSITLGILCILIWQRSFFQSLEEKESEKSANSTNSQEEAASSDLVDNP